MASARSLSLYFYPSIWCRIEAKEERKNLDNATTKEYRRQVSDIQVISVSDFLVASRT